MSFLRAVQDQTVRTDRVEYLQTAKVKSRGARKRRDRQNEYSSVPGAGRTAGAAGVPKVPDPNANPRTDTSNRYLEHSAPDPTANPRTAWNGYLEPSAPDPNAAARRIEELRWEPIEVGDLVVYYKMNRKTGMKKYGRVLRKDSAFFTNGEEEFLVQTDKNTRRSWKGSKIGRKASIDEEQILVRTFPPPPPYKFNRGVKMTAHAWRKPAFVILGRNRVFREQNSESPTRNWLENSYSVESISTEQMYNKLESDLLSNFEIWDEKVQAKKRKDYVFNQTINQMRDMELEDSSDED